MKGRGINAWRQWYKPAGDCNNKSGENGQSEWASESEGGFLHRVCSVVRCVRCKWCFCRLRWRRLRLAESHSSLFWTHHLWQMIVITLTTRIQWAKSHGYSLKAVPCKRNAVINAQFSDFYDMVGRILHCQSKHAGKKKCCLLLRWACWTDPIITSHSNTSLKLMSARENKAVVFWWQTGWPSWLRALHSSCRSRQRYTAFARFPYADLFTFFYS